MLKRSIRLLRYWSIKSIQGVRSMNWTEQDLQDYLKRRGKAPEATEKSKRAKYNNKRVRVDGVLFDSQREAQRYSELKLMLQAGYILGFCRQPEFILMEGNEQESKITYSPDFIVFYPDRVEIEDVKGFESQQWERTFKMFRLKYPNLELKIIK